MSRLFACLFLMLLPATLQAEQPPATEYGHLPYAEAPADSLVAFCDGNSNRLRTEVAEVVKQMKADAKKEGVTLRAISCFRSINSQNYLFHEIAKQRGQTLEERAKVSAPPGHSEHHTGYAIDFGDANGKTDLKETFADTPAGRWLAENGPSYGFELSFPKGNTQGVSYEPWHWRYVGTPEAMETFSWARRLYPADPAVIE